MAKKHKRKAGYTVLLVPNSPEKSSKELHALPKLIISIIAVFVMLIVAGIIVISYQQSIIIQKQNSLNSKDKEIVSCNSTIDGLKADIDVLKADIVSANRLTRLANQDKIKAENKYLALEEEVYNLCAPTGCPVTGTATIPDDKRRSKDQLVIFETYLDANVIAAGNGKVIDIQYDESSEYQYTLIIDHGNNYTSIYKCSESPIVSRGATVQKGEALFHITKETENFGYQIMEEDKYIDPWTIIEISG